MSILSTGKSGKIVLIPVFPYEILKKGELMRTARGFYYRYNSVRGIDIDSGSAYNDCAGMDDLPEDIS